MGVLSASSKNLKTLIPAGVFVIPENLAESIEKYGILNPLLISENLVIDGQKRLEVALKQNLKEVPVVQVSGLPFILRWQVNMQRPWSPVEIAFTAANIPETILPEFCASMQLPLSPHLSRSFKFITLNPEFWNDLIENRITLQILRDLAHLDEKMNIFSPSLASLKATMAEKRILAGLLRQCAKRGKVPDRFESEEFEIIRDQLESICQPRRTEAMHKYSQTISELEFPAGTKIDIDPSFEHPGVVVHVGIKKNQLYKLAEIGKSLDRLFSKMSNL